MGTLWTAGTDITAAMLNQYYGASDAAATTVTAAAQTDLSSLYTIPASEPSAGSAYELVCGGNGIWATAGPQTLQFAGFIAGSAFGAAPTIAAAAFATSAAFRWEARIFVTFSANGVSGSAIGNLAGCLTQTANSILPGTAADNTIPFCDGSTSGLTVNTTASMIIKLRCQWGATTGNPTITNRFTVFRKVS